MMATILSRVGALALWCVAIYAVAHASTEGMAPIRYAAGGAAVLLTLAGVSVWAGGSSPSTAELAERARMRAAAKRHLDETVDSPDVNGGRR